MNSENGIGLARKSFLHKFAGNGMKILLACFNPAVFRRLETL